VARRDLWRLQLALRKGTILISRMNTVELVGESGYVDADYPNLFVPDRLWMATIRSMVDPLWLSYVLTWQPVKSQISASATGTSGSMKNVSKPSLRAVKIPYPPVDEQRAIAAALSDVDALLGGLDRLIAKKRDLKQAAMQQLLTGHRRLPGFHAEWDAKRLGECLLSRPDYGVNAVAVPYSDRFPTYIRITDISDDGRFRPDPRVSLKVAGAQWYFLNQGDLVFARTGASVGKSYLYDPRDGELAFAGFLIRVRPDPQVLVPAFLAAYVTTEPYWNWVRLMSMRSGQPGINGSEYAQLPLRLPTRHEQAAIAAVLADMDGEIAALEARRDKTSDLKQAMMQELLTGKTRLVPARAVCA
jgi:type I restriction enzyme S subunit